MSVRLDIQIIVEEADFKPINQTVDELTTLMCYREVRAVFEYVGHHYITTPSIFNAVFNQLANDYPKPIVVACLEKYKNENE